MDIIAMIIRAMKKIHNINTNQHKNKINAT
jgi:hypothetical protein